MYAFAYPLKHGRMAFIAFGDHIFTYPTAALAQADFKGIRAQAHLYSLDLNLGVARLLEKGDGQEAPVEFEPTEKQKQGLYESFVYKSLLEWAPEHDENMP